MRMNAADTNASRAIADCTPLTVVPMSFTTAEIDTFMIDVSTTSTNIAIASSKASVLLVFETGAGETSGGSGCGVTSSTITDLRPPGWRYPP
jgi:hypothetical protein